MERIMKRSIVVRSRAEARLRRGCLSDKQGSVGQARFVFGLDIGVGRGYRLDKIIIQQIFSAAKLLF
jgi:hypothetical protein